MRSNLRQLPSHQNVHTQSDEAFDVHVHVWGATLHIIAIATGILSVAAFVAGMVDVYHSIATLGLLGRETAIGAPG